MISNLEEIKARKGPVIAIACEGDDRIAELADDVIYVPRGRRLPAAPGGRGAAAAFGLPHRPASRLQRRPAAEPGQERDGRVTARGIVATAAFGGLGSHPTVGISRTTVYNWPKTYATR